MNMTPKRFMTYREFIETFQNIPVTIKVPVNNEMSLEEWKDNLLLYCGKEILDRKLCGSELNLCFKF